MKSWETPAVSLHTNRTGCKTQVLNLTLMRPSGSLGAKVRYITGAEDQTLGTTLQLAKTLETKTQHDKNDRGASFATS